MPSEISDFAFCSVSHAHAEDLARRTRAIIDLVNRRLVNRLAESIAMLCDCEVPLTEQEWLLVCADHSPTLSGTWFLQICLMPFAANALMKRVDYLSVGAFASALDLRRTLRFCLSAFV